jgi:hypothetical protein
MKVPSFFSGRLLRADDFKSEQDYGKGKQPPPTLGGTSAVSDTFERAAAGALASLLRPAGGAGGSGVGQLVAGAMAEALGDATLRARVGAFEEAAPQIKALPEFPAVAELGKRALLGDGSVKEGFLGGLGGLAVAPGVDHGALLFHVFSEALGAAVPELAQGGPVDRATLSDEIRQLEGQQEEVRNRRQTATTSFQSFDQKSNQLLNLLSTVVKTMGEMRGVGAGGRSGL